MDALVLCLAPPEEAEEDLTEALTELTAGKPPWEHTASRCSRGLHGPGQGQEQTLTWTPDELLRFYCRQLISISH